MKVITVIIVVSVVAITTAITVPPSWPTASISNVPQPYTNRFRPVQQGSEIYAPQSRPYVAPTRRGDINNSGRNSQQYNTRHHNLKKRPEQLPVGNQLSILKPSASGLKKWKPEQWSVRKKQTFKPIVNDWIPIVYPKPHQTAYYEHIPPDHTSPSDKYRGGKTSEPLHAYPRQTSPSYTNYRDDKTHEPGDIDVGKISEPLQIGPRQTSLSNSNYRDDTTHEPHDIDNGKTSEPLQTGPDQTLPLYTNYREARTHELHNTDTESDAEDQTTHPTSSSHEKPADIPTEPIYPGAGKWAQRGKNYRPHITKHRFDKIREDDDEEQPEGYETYEENKNLFNKQQDNFRENIDEFPKKQNLGSYIEERDDNSDKSDEENEFVPTRTYSQVRRSEAEEHLPPESALEDRLREVVKDSKIQIVYTEEGYEDSAYDHEGHEKNAEQDEGFSEFDREIKKAKKSPKSKHETDEEEEIKGDDDSATAGSQYHTIDKPASVMPANVKPANAKMNKNNFIKTKETKTISIKGRGGGEKELEISSEIKAIVTPNNETEAHKYVRIFPKVYRYDDIAKGAITSRPVNKTANKEVAAAALTQQLPQMLPLESAMTTVKKSYSKIERAKRFKRFTNDYPKIVVDTDFIDKIKHPDLPKIVDTSKATKYPYYGDPKINPDSPLRYSEDLSNIPNKKDDDLAFYNQAEKTKCPEVEVDVDPIPERVKNAETRAENMEETKDVEELPTSPRLNGLGDKIDCFKLKYFGEHPLDSPIFDEETIAPVVPIFSTFTPGKNRKRANIVEKATVATSPLQPEQTKTKEILSNLDNTSEHETNAIGDGKEPKDYQGLTTVKPDEDLGFNILKDVIGQFSKSKDDPEVTTSAFKPAIQTTNATKVNPESSTEVPTISIITTPKYTIDLKPKHIYDQIVLLKYLPIFNYSSIPTTVTTTSTSTIGPLSVRQSKSLESDAVTTTEKLPESQSLILRKRRRKIRRRFPAYHIFDVNYFLPTNPNQFLDRIIQSTPVPQYNGLSEVYYKNEIKPNEQLNVLTDVINNIKNFSKDPYQAAASQSSGRIEVELNTFNNNYHRTKTLSEIVNTKLKGPIEEADIFYPTMSTTTIQPSIVTLLSRPKKNSPYKVTDQIYKDLFGQGNIQYDGIELLKTNSEVSTTTAVPKAVYEDYKGSSTSVDPVKEPPNDVLGLMPPTPNLYKTIFNPKLNKQSIPSNPINNYYVRGMKPPSAKQKIQLYSDFKFSSNDKTKYGFHRRRSRRSAQRPGYFEVVRNRNKPIDVVDDDAEVALVDTDDEYVPHRPKNYHYDEETGRIVYDKPKKEEVEEEEYVEIIEVTEAPIPKPTRKSLVATTTARFFERFVDNHEGPSFTEFVKTLKSDPSYQAFPDPTTTEKGKVVATISTTTPTPVSTNPPEFLNILSKVKSDANYKPLVDKNKTKITTTTEASEEVVDESQLENVQNSPGGQLGAHNFQIFDINDYLPKIKNYSLRTSIDYSKYKTIERSSVPLRHNLSSRYNSEEEALEDVKTVRVPILLEKVEKQEPLEFNPVGSESKLEEVEPTSRPIKEVTRTTTKKIPIRSRVRGVTRRPSHPTTVSPRTITETVKQEEVTVHNDKPKRVYPRRRPTRIKLSRTTTEKNSFDPVLEESEDTTKIVRRRHQVEADVPAEVFEETTKENLKTKRDRIVTPEQEALNINRTQPLGTPSRIEPRSIDARVDVFQKYDKTKKHGGTYRREGDVKEGNVKVDNTEADGQQDESGKAELQEKPVEVFLKYDKTKKHGGNYRKEDDENEGNVKETDGQQNGSKKTELQQKSVEVFQKYDKTKKHGGNYRREDEVKEDDEPEDNNKGDGLQEENAELQKPVDAFKEYDKTKKHGGNYRREEDYEESRLQDDGEQVESGNTEVKRLTDVVPKADTFYTDPKLAKNINRLVEPNLASVEEIEVESGVEVDDKEVDSAYDDVEVDFDDRKTTSTKKPIFIKDPSKRLYYYAPI